MAFWFSRISNGLWALFVLAATLPQASAQWSPPQGPYHSPIVGLAHDPASSNVFYAAHGDGGLIKSQDGGLSWTRIGPTDLKFRQVIVDPFNSQALYGLSSGQLFKSADGGATWSRAGGSYGQTYSIDLDPTRPGVAYLLVDRIVLKTTDDGLTWVEILRVPAPETVGALAIDPTNPNIVFVGGFGTALRRSNDGGLTWAPTQTGLDGQSVFDIEVVAQDPSSVFAATFSGVFRSADGGATWLRTGLASGQVTDIVIDPKQTQHVLVAHRDRGVMQSFNAGATWTGLNTGLEEFQIVGLLAVQVGQYEWLAATTRNGFFALSAGESTWANIGHMVEAAKVTSLGWSADRSVLFAGTDRQGLFATRDGGKSWQVSAGALDGLRVDGLLTPDTSNAPIYAVSANRVFRSDTSGRTWNELRTQLAAGSRIQGLHLHPQVPNTLFLATSVGVFRSFNGGSTWSAADLADQSVVSVGLDAVQPDVVYVATASGALFKSVDRGTRWEDISANITSDGVALVVADAKVGGRVYLAAKSAGLFVSNDRGTTWAKADGTLGGAAIARLFVAADGALYGADREEIYRSRDGGANWTALALGGIGDITAASARSGGHVAVAIDGAGVAIAQFSDSDIDNGAGGPSVPGGGGGGGVFWLMLVPLAAVWSLRRGQR